MKLRSSKIWFRITLLCIVIGIIPTFIVGLFSYYKASEVVQDKVNNSNMQLLLQTRMSVEQLLLMADKSLFNFIDSPVVKQNYNSKMNPTEFQIINDIESSLNGLQTYDLGIDQADIVNFDTGWLMDSNGFHLLEDFDQKVKLKALAAVPQKSFWINEGSTLTEGAQNDLRALPSSPGGVVRVIKIPVNAPVSSGFAALMIPYSKLSSLILSNNQIGEIMILDSNYRVLANNDPSMWDRDLSDSVYAANLKDANNTKGFFQTAINKKTFVVTYLKSDYNGWIYISKSYIRDNIKDSISIRWFTFITCVIVMLVVILISLIISRKIYNPIFRIYRLIAGKQDTTRAFQNKHDEFKIIEESIELLTKDNDLLKNQIYDQLPQLKEFFVLKLALGETELGEVEEKLMMYGYPQPKKWMCVFVIRIDTLEGTQFKERDLDLMFFAVNNIIGEVVAEALMLTGVVLNKSQITIIGSDHETYEEFKNYIYSVAEVIQTAIEKNLKLTVSIGISRPIGQYKEVNRGYLEGLQALKHQIKLGYKAVIYIQDVLPENNMRFVFPLEIENEILKAVDICDYAKSREYLHQFIAKVFMVKLNHNEYMVSLVKLLIDLLHLLQKYGKSSQLLNGEGKNLFEQLFELKAVNEIENWFDRVIIIPLIKMIEDTSKKHHVKIVEDIIQIVHTEYDTDLTLDECASRMDYHPSYIRRILKNEAGINFYDYLCQYRINIAKKWLVETDIKILDIAEKLRYNNPQNFIRSFRKATGTTPGQYRDHNQ